MTLTSQILGSLTFSKVAIGLGVFFVAWTLYTVTYRRFFHPLAKVPGPFLPAVTTLVQSYYNGNYFKKIEEYHKKYGLSLYSFSAETLLTRIRSNSSDSAERSTFSRPSEL
jgi:hypothetical protein